MEHFLRTPSRQPPYPNTYLLLSGGSGPVSLPRALFAISSPLSWLEGPQGSGHPDPDFTVGSHQHNQQPCSRSTSRRNTPCHGFQDSNRKISRPPPRTIWHGIWITAAQNVANSIRNSVRLSAWCWTACRGDTGTIK